MPLENAQRFHTQRLALLRWHDLIDLGEETGEMTESPASGGGTCIYTWAYRRRHGKENS